MLQNYHIQAEHFYLILYEAVLQSCGKGHYLSPHSCHCGSAFRQLFRMIGFFLQQDNAPWFTFHATYGLIDLEFLQSRADARWIHSYVCWKILFWRRNRCHLLAHRDGCGRACTTNYSLGSTSRLFSTAQAVVLQEFLHFVGRFLIYILGLSLFWFLNLHAIDPKLVLLLLLN